MSLRTSDIQTHEGTSRAPADNVQASDTRSSLPDPVQRPLDASTAQSGEIAGWWEREGRPELAREENSRGFEAPGVVFAATKGMYMYACV